MLRLVATLGRSVGGGGGGGGGRHHHLHGGSFHIKNSNALIRHCQYCSVDTNARLVFVRKRHDSFRLPKAGPKVGGAVSWRGLATTSTNSGSPNGSGFTAWYLRMLDRYPLPTKSVTAASILAAADMTAQYLANMTVKDCEPKQDWDKMRTLRMCGIGAFFSAPILHMWFNLMQRILPHNDIASSVKKVLAGQLIASPIVNAAFFAVNSFLQGEGVDQAIEKIKSDLWPTWKSGAMYWPLLDFATFRYVPIHLQVFFNNCCSFIWTIYLTSMAGKKSEAPTNNQLQLHNKS